MSYKKVIAAVQLDDKSIATLSKMKNLNFDKGTEIHLVHVVEITPSLAEIAKGFEVGSQKSKEIALEVEERLKKISEHFGLDGVNFVFKGIVCGNRRQEFLAYVESQKADLVIAASKEREGFKGFFEGSFTNFLTKFCKMDLVIFRP